MGVNDSYGIILVHIFHFYVLEIGPLCCHIVDRTYAQEKKTRCEEARGLCGYSPVSQSGLDWDWTGTGPRCKGSFPPASDLLEKKLCIHPFIKASVRHNPAHPGNWPYSRLASCDWLDLLCLTSCKSRGPRAYPISYVFTLLVESRAYNLSVEPCDSTDYS
jgi:hypothetical protein